jgi:hypothetical protein
MPRVKVGPALPDGSTLDVEIARLRDLDVASLQARSRNMFRRRPSPHLPRHLLFRVLAYRLQAERLGDLDVESRRLLDGAGPPEDAGKRAVDLNRPTAELRPGTMLAREWNGRMHRVAVLVDGFAWNGKTYPSLSKIAPGHHGHPLERTQILWLARQSIEGGAIMKGGRIEASSLRDLHPCLHRPRAGTGLQLPRRPV